jgi:membrane associated rhomboid family serine protease
MRLISLIVLLGAVWYFTTPQERERLRRLVLRRVDEAWGGFSRYWPAPTPFDAALDARTPHPVVTFTVLALNLGIFVCMVFGNGSLADPDTLLGWGASVGTRTANGEWWRLATALFVHASFLHMIVNVIGLVQVGLLTERFFGRFAFANAYLGAGLLFGVFTVLQHPIAITTGASASVFAIYGMFVAMLVTGITTPSPFSVPSTTLLKLAPSTALFLFYSFAAGHTSMLELSGILVGLAYGFVLAKSAAVQPTSISIESMEEAGPPAADPELPLKRIAPITVAIVVIVVGAGIPMRGVIDVRPEISHIAEIETKTAAVYDAAVRQFTSGQLTLKELVGVIERSILPELRAEQTRLQQLRHVPREQAKLVAEADQYFKLRQESWQARAAGLRRTSLKGLRSPDDTEREAREVLESLIPNH